jgi:hypothetical protein
MGWGIDEGMPRKMEKRNGRPNKRERGAVDSYRFIVEVGDRRGP